MSDIDSLCAQINNVSFETPKLNIMNDLLILVSEIGKGKNLNVDIYEICISCGNDLIWSRNYNITKEDIIWLNNHAGFIFFMQNLNKFIDLNTIEKYNLALKLYYEIANLFDNCASI